MSENNNARKTHLTYKMWQNLDESARKAEIGQAVKNKDFKTLDSYIAYGGDDISFNYAMYAIQCAEAETETIEYIVSRHLKKLDYETALEKVIRDNNMMLFDIIYAHRDQAAELQEKVWSDLGADKTISKTLNKLAASTSNSKTDFYDHVHVMEFALNTRASAIVGKMLDIHEFDQDSLDYILEKWMSRNGPGQSTVLIDLMLKKGSNPSKLDNTALSMLLDIEEILENDVLSETIDARSDDVLDLLISFKNEVLIKKHYARFAPHLERKGEHVKNVLNTNITSLIAYFLSDLGLNNYPEITEYLENNMDSQVPLMCYQEVATHADPRTVSKKFVTELLKDKVNGKGWSVFGILVDREDGFDINTYPDVARKLLPQAIKRKPVSKTLVDKLLKLPDLEGLGQAVTAAFKYNEDGVLYQISSKYKIPFEVVDWQECYDAMSSKAELRLSVYKTLNNDLFLQQFQADSVAGKVLEGLNNQPSANQQWEEAMKDIVKSRHCADILQALHQKKKIRFKAETFLQENEDGVRLLDMVCGYKRHQAFFNHAYWDQDIAGLQAMYNAAPEYVQRDLGSDFITLKWVNKTVSNFKSRKKPLPRR